MNGLIKYFVRHPVAPNLAMFIMIIAGLWATAQLTRQLLPSFALNQIEVSVVWPGSTAEDVEALITQPIEDELQSLDDLKTSSSISQEGLSKITLEFPEGIDLSAAQDRVKDLVGQVRNLPASAETPQVSLRARDEPVARMVVIGPDLGQMRPVVRQIETDLRRIGISRFEVSGLPAEEIAIEVDTDTLRELGLSLNEIANRIRGESQDLPAGTVGELDIARQLRSLDQRRSVEGFRQVPIGDEAEDQFLRLGDISRIERRFIDGQTLVFADGSPAVEFSINRAETEDALDSAAKLYSWLETVRAELPANFDIVLYGETWRNVESRIDLMVNNAFTGLVLVLIVLFIFLNARVAFWVAVGIPVAILASLVALDYFGGSINILTLFALIMTFGIIVDDAIVVGERAVTLYNDGAGPVSAAETAATTMLAPVTAASLTTIAAFVPLMTIGGTTGNLLFSIPLIVICVVIASLIECFIVLPGHLKHALENTAQKQPNPMRRKIEKAFKDLQQGRFRDFLSWAIENRRLTLTASLAGFIVIFGLALGGRLGFSFFPQPEGTTITANIRFVAGTPQERVQSFIDQAEQALAIAQQRLGEEIVVVAVKKVGQDSRGTTGSNVGHIVVELIPGDLRNADNADLIRVWRQSVPPVPGLEYFLILNSRGGPPGSDIDIQISDADPAILKQASVRIQELLAEFAGVSGIRDDTSFGQEQLILELTPAGRALGLTSQALGEQLRAKFEGELVQIFQDQGEEVEVRVSLAGAETRSLRSLETLSIQLPDRTTASLDDVARLNYGQGFDTLKHSDGRLAIRVTADVDPKLNNANALRARLGQEFLPTLESEFGVSVTQRGQAENQSESLGDVTLALPIALVLIYIILAWVFQSYTWPFAVLSIVPFGLIGAIFGHWLLGYDITLLSIFGFFGLTGIVINDSIILVDVYRRLREEGMPVVEAVLDAGCARFRAVMLTSITTVAGIMPILLESSSEAEFLKPMVISIGFGLIFGTLLVLVLLPAVLVILESLRSYLGRVKTQFTSFLLQNTPARALTSGLAKAMTFNDPTTLSTGTRKRKDGNETGR